MLDGGSSEEDGRIQPVPACVLEIIKQGQLSDSMAILSFLDISRSFGLNGLNQITKSI
jgi:hypothetical protein